MLDLSLLGTGGMMPLPGRWLTALMTRYNGKGLLIDCGEGTQIALKQCGWSCHDIDIICFTHYHGDHISGLPGLLLSMGNAERKEPVTLVGPKGLERVVSALRVIAPELPFEVKFVEIPGAEFHLELCGYQIDAFRVNHNVICYGYTLSIKRGGRFYAEKAQELQIPLKFWNRLQKGETVTDGENTYTPDMVLGPERKGIKLTYCTDTRPTQSLVKYAEHADLLICEGMYGEAEKQTRASEYKHMTFAEAARVAKEADVAELWLTHYSPSLVRPKDALPEAKRIFANTKCGKDGMSVTLEFDKEE